MEHAANTPANHQHRSVAERASAGRSMAAAVDQRFDAAANRLLLHGIDRSPRLIAQRDATAGVASSPRVSAQRQRLTAILGAAAQLQPADGVDKLRTQATTSSHGFAVQRVRGGIEYTEDGPTMLYAYNR